jgi:hypothetical protein
MIGIVARADDPIPIRNLAAILPVKEEQSDGALKSLIAKDSSQFQQHGRT